jgi:Fe-S cluster assembly protein SufD
MSTAAIDTGLLARVVSRLPGDALTPLRQEALRRFSESGFPTTRHEDWRYTNLAPLVEVSNLWLRDEAASGAAAIPASDAVRQYAADLASRIDAYWIVIANGMVLEDSLESLNASAFHGPDAIAAANESLAQSASADEPMTRFNTALLRDLLRITIPAGKVFDKPFGLLMIDDDGGTPALSQTRVVIETEPGARAEIIEYHASTGGSPHFANVVTDLELAHGAAVNYVRIQQRNPAHFQTGKLTVRLRRDSHFHHTAFDLGGGLIRNDIDVSIEEPDATVTLYGLYLASGRQHMDNHTRVDHLVGPASSTEEYRGILSDRSRCVFNGKAIVHRGADGTDARQANHNLLLSDKAEIDTKPELEIYADDVKCAHGATTGQLDTDALFYLRSRGIDEHTAKSLLTFAFSDTVLARMGLASLRRHAEQLVVGRLPDADLIREFT